MSVKGQGTGMHGCDAFWHACYQCRHTRLLRRAEKKSSRQAGKAFWRKDQD